MSARSFRRGEPGYEEARRASVANARTPDRHPDAIVQAATDEDVVEAVRTAVGNDWRIAVRSGGHSWSGNHLRDDGLLIDLSRMTGATLDAEARTAIVQPGLRSSQLARMLAEHDRFFPTGHCTGPSLGGYLLQGGFGWNSRILGPGCLSVEAIDVVTAGGELVHADDRDHADLYWAARGSGPGFPGVVTRFHVRLHPRPPVQMSSAFVYPVELLDEVMRWAHAVGPDAPRTMELMVFMRRDLPGHPGPGLLVTGPTLAGSEDEARDALALLDTCPVVHRAVHAERFVHSDVVSLVEGSDDFYPAGRRYAADNMWTHAPIEDLLPGLRDVAATLPASPSHMMWMNWGPSPERPDMAFSLEDQYYIALYAVWPEAHDDARFADWPTERMRAMEPFAHGIQLADENLGRRPARFVADENLRRIDAVRARYDPDRRFHDYMGRP